MVIDDSDDGGGDGDDDGDDENQPRPAHPPWLVQATLTAKPSPTRTANALTPRLQVDDEVVIGHDSDGEAKLSDEEDDEISDEDGSLTTV